MPVETMLICGPPCGGKSTVAGLIVGSVLDRPGHFLRLRAAADDYTNTIIAAEPARLGCTGAAWASAHRVTYTADRVFETLPDALRTVREIDRYGFVVVEADPDPAIRHAFPYDYRLFVMAPPADVTEVFREPKAAAAALQQVMQDTASFASEIFGLFDAAGLDDGAEVLHEHIPGRAGTTPPLERLDIGEAQIRQFLSSPLGAEIASRIQLQPAYHALVESDVVVLNTGAGRVTPALDECVRRLEKLLGRVRHDARRHSVLYWGDVTDGREPTQDKLVRRLRALLGAEG